MSDDTTNRDDRNTAPAMPLTVDEYERQLRWVGMVREALPTASENDLRTLAETCLSKIERFARLAVKP